MFMLNHVHAIEKCSRSRLPTHSIALVSKPRGRHAVIFIDWKSPPDVDASYSEISSQKAPYQIALLMSDPNITSESACLP